MKKQINPLGQPIGYPMSGWLPPPFPKRDTREGRICRLEPLSVDKHAQELYQANQNDPEDRNWTYHPYGPFGSFVEYQAWLAEQAVAEDPQFYAIVERASGRAVGLASYLRIDPAAGSIEVGHLHFSPLLQRKPAATDAMYLLMKRAFELGYRRYEWRCDALNAPSHRAAERLGFLFEGTFRQTRVIKNFNRDTTWLSILDCEWPAVRAALERWLAPENFDAKGRQKVSLSALTAAIR